MLKKLPLVFLFSFALIAGAVAAVTIKVDAKDGDSITGQRVFRATVESEHNVTSVEFYVNDALRSTTQSVPYDFSLDSIAEPDGPIKLRFTAYTAEGEKAESALTLKVANGLDQGVAVHVQKGNDYLTNGKWNQAIDEARIGLKIKKDDVSARLLMARANYEKGVYDTAQQYAEYVIAAEPNNAFALDLLSAINLEKAFNTFSRESKDKKKTLDIINGALTSAINQRTKVLEQEFDKFGEPTDENLAAWSDLAVKAGHYSTAIEKLKPAFHKNYKNNAIGNRLLYIQIRSGRYKDALETFTAMTRYGSPDSVGTALNAILLDHSGIPKEKVDAVLLDAVGSDPDNLAVRTTSAYIALARGDTKALGKFAVDLAKTEGATSVVNYYLASSYFSLGQFEDSRRKFETAVLAEPTSYEVYIERSNQAIAIARAKTTEQKEDKDYQLQIARAYMSAALLARPSSFECLTGMAVLNLLDGKSPEALDMARAAVTAGPEYAPAYFALSTSLSSESARVSAVADRLDISDPKQAKQSEVLRAQSQKMLDDAQKAVDHATALDPINLAGGIPSPDKAWIYFYRHGRTPWIILPR